MFVWWSRLRGCFDVGLATTLHVEYHLVHDPGEMPNENLNNFHNTPHRVHMTNVSTSPNHGNPHQMYVPTSSPAMVRIRSNRLNDVGLDVQYHDKYDMGILRKIAKIFIKDLLKLE